MTTKISLLLKICYFCGTIVLDTKTAPIYKQCFALNLLLLIGFSQLVDVKYHDVKSINLQKHIEDLQKEKKSSVDITTGGSLRDGHLPLKLLFQYIISNYASKDECMISSAKHRLINT